MALSRPGHALARLNTRNMSDGCAAIWTPFGNDLIKSRLFSFCCPFTGVAPSPSQRRMTQKLNVILATKSCGIVVLRIVLGRRPQPPQDAWTIHMTPFLGVRALKPCCVVSVYQSHSTEHLRSADIGIEEGTNGEAASGATHSMNKHTRR